MWNWIENFFLHTGDAICGEKCCDESPRMHWLARIVNATLPPMDWTEDGECRDWLTRVRFGMYYRFYRWGIWASRYAVNKYDPDEEPCSCGAADQPVSKNKWVEAEPPCDYCSDYCQCGGIDGYRGR